MVWFFLLMVTLAASGINIALSKKKRDLVNVIEIFLVYLFAINIGVMGILAFYQHAFNSAAVAKMIGWTTSPFQFEMAVTNLGIGIAGLLCIRYRGDFWLAVALISTIISWGCSWGHWHDMVVNMNYAPYNAGPGIWFADVVIPAILLGLVLLHRRLKK